MFEMHAVAAGAAVVVFGVKTGPTSCVACLAGAPVPVLFEVVGTARVWGGVASRKVICPLKVPVALTLPCTFASHQVCPFVALVTLVHSRAGTARAFLSAGTAAVSSIS